jgi:hypothetical protein
MKLWSFRGEFAALLSDIEGVMLLVVNVMLFASRRIPFSVTFFAGSGAETSPLGF